MALVNGSRLGRAHPKIGGKVGDLSETEVERRLLTILAAGVAGVDRLLAGDAADARARLDAAMEALAQRVAAHDGLVRRTAGGSMVAEFDSPVEAVRCALATQRAMAEDDEAPERRLLFRLGIDLDGRNGAASRLEAMAEAGGACLSGAVREQIHGIVDLEAEGAMIAESAGGDAGTPGYWRIAPLAPGQVPAIPIPASQPAPPAEPEPYAEERRLPLLRLSLAVAAVAVGVAVYFVFLRTNPLPDDPASAPPLLSPGRVAGPALPGRPFVPEQVPFVDAADRARLKAEYMTASPYKAIAISRGNASFWYVQGQAGADAASESALESCRRNAPEPCELYALGDELVWERPLPPVPLSPWLPAEGERVETPFDAARVPLAGPAMRRSIEAEYAPRRPAKALALAQSGTVGFATRRPTVEDAVRAALESCGDLTGTACAVIAVDDMFVVPVPGIMRTTGLFRPEFLRPFAEHEFKRLAEQYLPRGGWKAVALGKDGRMGIGAGKALEQEAIDAALADCRAAKPPSSGPGGVAAAVLGNTPPECAVHAIGIFTVEAK